MFSLRMIILSIVIALVPISSMASAPDLKLKDLSGTEHHLSQFIGQGQWTVVVLWAEDCEVCNAEIQTLDFFHDEHKARRTRSPP